ncbi:MAG: alpha-amylase family glycosyl hydrolase [Bacillota bacterium]|nr:alpha-amylase family glycosyl hydrolase [Bacillota bacterium]
MAKLFNHKLYIKAGCVVLSLCMILTFVGIHQLGVQAAGTTNTTASSTYTVPNYGLATNVQDGVILHCWNWSYNNIKNFMPQIAAAGYSAIQTSPVTQPKDFYYNGVNYSNVGTPNGTGGTDGNWWKEYQPVSESIDDNGLSWYGSKADFVNMCNVAHQYGVKVIVDIVANHMGNIKGWINNISDVSPQVGQYCNPALLTDATYWHNNSLQVWMSDGRQDLTQGTLGMPDLNTQDKRVQNMILNLLDECVDAGADGFRFDAAKHIETPQDDASFASDFWPTVLNGVKAHSPRPLWFYGEILNTVGTGFSINNYTQYMSVTDNATGDNRRNDIRYGNAGSAANSGMSYDPKKTVLWDESHDTYMGGGSSYLATDTMIKQTWALVATHEYATALFFARPYYSTQILNSDGSPISSKTSPQTMMGDVGTMTWCDPSVSAVNNFHNYFIGKSESYGSSGHVVYNVRGNAGIVLDKLDGPGAVSVPCGSMPNGTYTDQVTGNTFTVSGGNISGTIASSDGIAVVYNRTAMPTSSISVPGGNFSTDTLSLTLGLKNATSGTYQINGGAVTPYTDGTQITIGSGVAYGSSIVVTMTASDGTNTITEPFTFTKAAAATIATVAPTSPSTGPTSPPATLPVGTGVNVYFDNSTSSWSNVYCYVYNSSSDTYKTWPGEQMTSLGNNIYGYNIPAAYASSGKVLFSNGNGSQIPGSGQPGLALSGQNMIYQNGSWSIYNSSTTSPTTAPTNPLTTTPTVAPTNAPTVTPTTAPNVVRGDANCDGVCSLKDATLIQKYVAMITSITPQGLLNGDANLDGVCNLKDATTIQKYLAKGNIW